MCSYSFKIIYKIPIYREDLDNLYHFINQLVLDGFYFYSSLSLAYYFINMRLVLVVIWINQKRKEIDSFQLGVAGLTRRLYATVT